MFERVVFAIRGRVDVRYGGREGGTGAKEQGEYIVTSAISIPAPGGNGLSLTNRKKLPNNSNPFLRIIEAEPIVSGACVV